MTKFKLDTRWAIVAVGFVALSLAFSGRSMLSLAMAEWTAEFGWTKASIESMPANTAALAPTITRPPVRMTRGPLRSMA